MRRSLKKRLKSVSSKVPCLICEKKLELDESVFLYGGGSMDLSFGYGSSFDEIMKYKDKAKLLAANPDISDAHMLVALSDVIQAYICDECFEKKHRLVAGISIRVTKERKEVDLNRGV